jgi:hypothetical protein
MLAALFSHVQNRILYASLGARLRDRPLVKALWGAER